MSTLPGQEKDVVCVAYSAGGKQHLYYTGGARDKHATEFGHGRWCPKCNYWHGGAYLCEAPAPPVPFDEVDNDNPQFDPIDYVAGMPSGYEFGMRGGPLRRR